MTAYITKYALTQGIIEVKGQAFGRSGFAYEGQGYTGHVHGNEWQLTKAAAITRAEHMRTAKIASHREAIAKLEQLTFS